VREVDFSPPSSEEVENYSSHTSTATYAFMAPGRTDIPELMLYVWACVDVRSDVNILATCRIRQTLKIFD